jgi:hypothetical protein
MKHQYHLDRLTAEDPRGGTEPDHLGVGGLTLLNATVSETGTPRAVPIASGRERVVRAARSGAVDLLVRRGVGFPTRRSVK